MTNAVYSFNFALQDCVSCHELIIFIEHTTTSSPSMTSYVSLIASHHPQTVSIRKKIRLITILLKKNLMSAIKIIDIILFKPIINLTLFNNSSKCVGGLVKSKNIFILQHLTEPKIYYYCYNIHFIAPTWKNINKRVN